MPTPKFMPYMPKVNDTIQDKIKGMTNAYYEMIGDLNFIMQHLDETNVIRAKSVVAEWIYANDINADQITAGTITGITINGVTITGSAISGGTINGTTINVQESININPVSQAGIDFGYASIMYAPAYWGIEIDSMGGVNVNNLLTYNNKEVATQDWVITWVTGKRQIEAYMA